MKTNAVNALILKGGGVKGLAFTGALQELENAGFEFKTYVGTSAGAVAAVFLAAGYSPDDLEKILRKTNFTLFRDANIFRGLFNFVFWGGLYPGNALREWIENTLRERQQFQTHGGNVIRMADLSPQKSSRAIIFAAHSSVGTITFDSDGENSHSEVGHAVRLSSSIPGFFVPGVHDGRRVYDGGLLHNFPVEVYQRSRGPLNSPNAEEDFIALYLGKEVPPKNQSWWLFDIWRIITARDDTHVLKKHKERSITIDTEPIGMTDFDLSEDEKELLVNRGRCAALAFLVDQVDADDGKKAEHSRSIEKLREREANLLASTGKIRCKRRLIGWGRRTGVALLVTVLVWGVTSLTRIFDSYEVDDAFGYDNTYVSSSSVVRQLSEPSVKEIDEMYKLYPQQLADRCMPFDSLVQFVCHMVNPESDGARAVKVAVLDGVAQKPFADTLIKVSSSNASSSPTLRPFVFSCQDGHWVPVNATFQSDHVRDGVVEQILHLNHLDEDIIGLPIKLVLITTYSEVFKDSNGSPIGSIPWAIHAHRFLGDGGKATFMFFSDDPSAVQFPTHLYKKTGSDVFHRLRPPRGVFNSADRWSRVTEALDFLSGPSMKYPATFGEPLDATTSKSLADILDNLDKARDAAKAGKFDGTFTFIFDRSRSTMFDAKLTNLILFAEKYPQTPPQKQQGGSATVQN